MKLRVGVVGLGLAWEKRYRTALRALSDRFEVRAFCEPVALRAAQAAREFNAASVDGFRALSRREDVDAVMLLSRRWFGSLPILAACDAGKAVFCCDGLDLEVEAASRLKERIAAAGVTFMAEFPRRYAPATVRLKELIATRLGAPQLLFCHSRRSAEPAGPGKEDADPCTMAHHELVELVDWCSYVVGRDASSVVGVAHGARTGAFDGDYQMMSVEFAQDGDPAKSTVAQISCGRYMPAAWHEAITFRPPTALQVACENGIAFVDLPASLVWFDSAGRHMETLDSERPMGEMLLLQFHRSVTSLVLKTSSLEDAYKALSVVLAAKRSHAEGRRVPLEF
jgi:predicted dehydrogenase